MEYRSASNGSRAFSLPAIIAPAPARAYFGACRRSMCGQPQSFELGLDRGKAAFDGAQLRQRLALIVAGGARHLILEAGVAAFRVLDLGFGGGAIDLADRQRLVREHCAAFGRHFGETARDENPLRYAVLVVGIDVDDA